MSDSIISLNGDILAKNGRILKSLNGGGGGGSYSAGPGIDITNNTVSVKYDTDGLLTTDNNLRKNYYDVLYRTGKYFVQASSFDNWGDAESNLVEGRSYTVRLSARHQSYYQEGSGYAVTEDSTTLTWSSGMSFMWPDDHRIDLNWNYEDGASESDWANMNIGGCQLQLTDDVTGDVYYTGDFTGSQLTAYGEEGVLKVLVDKGNNGGDMLRWDSSRNIWQSESVSIPENVVMRDRMAATDMGHTADFTSNTITVNPSSHDQDWAGSIEIQNTDGNRTFKIHCICRFDDENHDIQATNATTTGTIVFASEWSEGFTLNVNARQTSSYDDGNEQTVIKIVTDEYSLPFQSIIGNSSMSEKYLESVSFTFAGLQSGGTALSGSFGMGTIVNEWSFS